jgi:hypothetical protein
MFVVCIYVVGFPGLSRQRAAGRRIQAEMQNV